MWVAEGGADLWSAPKGRALIVMCAHCTMAVQLVWASGNVCCDGAQCSATMEREEAVRSGDSVPGMVDVYEDGEKI